MGKEKSLEGVLGLLKHPHYSYILKILGTGKVYPREELWESIHTLVDENALYFKFIDLTGLDSESLENIRCFDIKAAQDSISIKSGKAEEWMTFPSNDESLLEFVQKRINDDPFGSFYDSIHGSPITKVKRIDSVRLSQLLYPLKSKGLVVKTDKGFQMTKQLTFQRQIADMYCSMMETYNGVADPSLGVYILYNHPSDYVDECLNRKLKSISDSLNQTLDNAKKLMIRARLEEIEQYMRKCLENNEFSIKEKAYILHYVRQQVENGLESFIYSQLEPFELIEPTIDEYYHEKTRYYEKNLDEYKTIFKDLLDRIIEPKFPRNYEFYQQLMDTAKQFKKGDICMDSEWEKTVMFELFSQTRFIFDFKPIIVVK